MKKDENLLKKQMTKKAWREHQKSNRSQVGLGVNLGTRSMGSTRDYSRSRTKKETRNLASQYL